MCLRVGLIAEPAGVVSRVGARCPSGVERLVGGLRVQNQVRNSGGPWVCNTVFEPETNETTVIISS